MLVSSCNIRNNTTLEGKEWEEFPYTDQLYSPLFNGITQIGAVICHLRYWTTTAGIDEIDNVEYDGLYYVSGGSIKSGPEDGDGTIYITSDSERPGNVLRPVVALPRTTAVSYNETNNLWTVIQ